MHNDIYGGQILFGRTKGENNGGDDCVLQCYVVDFGMVVSLDKFNNLTWSKKNSRRPPTRLAKNSFWYTQIQKKLLISEYILVSLVLEEFYNT